MLYMHVFFSEAAHYVTNGFINEVTRVISFTAIREDVQKRSRVLEWNQTVVCHGSILVVHVWRGREGGKEERGREGKENRREREGE